MKKSLLFTIVFAMISYVHSQTTPINTRLIEPTDKEGSFVKSYVKHLNSAKEELYLSVLVNADNTTFFNQSYNKGTRLISRLGENGLPKWTSKFIGDSNKRELNFAPKYSFNVDKDDNFYILTNTIGNSAFVDSAGLSTNIPFTSIFNSQKILLKIDKDGKLLWYKIIDTSFGSVISTDNNGDVFILGYGGYSIDNYALGSVYLIKLDGAQGIVNYVKKFNSSNGLFSVYQMIPTFDNLNNLYVFLEPMNTNHSPYNFDGVVIPTSTYSYDNLMLKFDSSGNVVFGKNFNTNNTDYSNNWINDAVFDGTDFILLGDLETPSDTSNYYLGLDGVQFPQNYATRVHAGLLAKVSTTGNVLWQKPIESKNPRGYYTNIDLDEDKNIYSYLYFSEKMKFDNIEYSFDALNGSKVISKFDTNGNLKYFYPVDNYHDTFNLQTNFLDYFVTIDVLGIDKLNVTGFTANNYFLNFPLNNSATPKLYVATFKGENLQTDDNQILSSKIFPNPTSDFLNIETKQTISKIEIFDLSGKLLKSENGKDKKVSVSELTKGMYLIKLYTENGVVNSKFIKK